MLKRVAVFTKKKAVALVLAAAGVLLLLAALRFLFPPDRINLSTVRGRESFLLELGWEADMGSEAERKVTVPEKLDGVMLKYNQLQQSQGYDLSEHLGESCVQYTYVLKNYPGYSDTVFVTLYVQGKKLIAGDVHTASADGFMQGLERADNKAGNGNKQ